MKIFVHLSDIQSENGPFCFVKETHPFGKYHSYTPQKTFKTDYKSFDVANDENMFNNIPMANRKINTGPFGHTVFVDTSG